MAEVTKLGNPLEQPQIGMAFGARGDPTVVTRESGEKFLAAVVADIVEIIKEIVK